MSFFVKPDPSLKVAPVAALDLSGKKITVVGGTDGLGRAIARLAAAKGASVTVVGRTFRDEGVAGLSFSKADLSLVSEAERVGREIPADSYAVFFTTGIVPGSTRAESAEGIEMDMAVSALSRHVALEQLAPRMLQANASGRVFVMGFPGTGQGGVFGDLNAEKSYAGGFGWVHMNTVAGNEALVFYWARKGLAVYGLNPGLISTGIRSNMMGKGWLASWGSWFMESLIGLFNPTPESYAKAVLPLVAAPELAGRKGAMFDQGGRAILPSKQFVEEPALADKWIEGLNELEARAKAGKK